MDKAAKIDKIVCADGLMDQQLLWADNLYEKSYWILVLDEPLNSWPFRLILNVLDFLIRAMLEKIFEEKNQSAFNL